MAIAAFSKLGQAVEDGKVHYQYLTKTTPPAAGTANFFTDLNLSGGQPVYNAFAGSALTATQLEGSGNRGIYTGPSVTGTTKHLLRWQMMNINTAANTIPPDHVYLNDYLMFYPLIDCDDVDVQVMDNTLSLPRYTDGEGVRIVLIASAPMTATASLTITYTNSEGVTGKTTTANVIPAANLGVCATGTGTSGAAAQATPFWPLADGCKGVRSIESVQFGASAGGFICAALVKPLATIMCYESSVPTEKMFGFEQQNPPEIKPGAYLNLLIQRSGTLAANYRSEFVFVWT